MCKHAADCHGWVGGPRMCAEAVESIDARSLKGLSDAVKRRFGESVRIDNVVVPTLGGINRTIIFDCIEAHARRRLVSREETLDESQSPFLTPQQQFRVMSLVHARGVPVPQPLFLYDERDDMSSGYVTSFVEGETIPARILRDPGFSCARERLAAQAGELLARLHSLNTEAFEFLQQTPDSVDPVTAWRERLDTYCEPHPAIELGLRWLERHRSAPASRVLVHGDFRLGNLMFGEEGIRSLLDWECTHLGRGIEDIGWLCTRSWRFGNADRPVAGLHDRTSLYAAYRSAGGATVDPDEARYWEVMGLVRWAVINVMQGYWHAQGTRRGIAYAAMGRNASLIEYELLMTLKGHYD